VAAGTEIQTEAVYSMTCGTPHGTALTLLEAFASVGARTFDVTNTTPQGAKVRFRRSVPLQELRRIIPAHLASAEKRQHNLIVGPRGPSVVFIQLDDLTAEAMQRVRAVSFLGLETSPRNYQAWIAMQQADVDFIRRLREGTGADLTASGATRVAGSFNFKDKYAPNSPRVGIDYSAPGLLARKEELAQLGLVAGAGGSAKDHSVQPCPRRPRAKRWPSYQRCVEGAPATRDGSRPDISRADFTWCMIAIDWGWSIEETASRLQEESAKARENGARYARLTSERAAAATDRRRIEKCRATLLRW